MQSAWSLDLSRDQCIGIPGLCFSLLILDVRATPAKAAGKYAKHPSDNGYSFLSAESLGSVVGSVIIWNCPT